MRKTDPSVNDQFLFFSLLKQHLYKKTQQTHAAVQVKSMQIFVPSSNRVYYVSIDMAVVRVKILTRRIC